MADQLSLVPEAPALPADLPPAVARILRAARSVSFRARVARGCWGVGVGDGRKWVLTGDCCCPLGALLVAEGAEAPPRSNRYATVAELRSPIRAAARLLGVEQDDVCRFVNGFDGNESGSGSAWHGYGRRVAAELGVG